MAGPTSLSWRKGSGLKDTVYALASAPSSPIVYAGTWGRGVYTAYITVDTTSWVSKENELKDEEISALGIDPDSPNIVYAGTYGGGLRWSTDGGESWPDQQHALGNSNVWSLAVTSTIAYAGVEGGGVYRSMDGIEWTPTGGELATTTICALAVDPITPTIVYAGTSGRGVYKSTNGGETWEPANGDILATTTIRALAINLQNTQVIYAGTQNEGIYRSEDGGQTWTPINEGLGADELSVLALAINPCNPRLVYAGVWGRGVYRSSNGGDSWQKMGELTDGAGYVYALTLAACPESRGCQILYAGTVDGVWDIITYPWVTYLPIIMKDYVIVP